MVRWVRCCNSVLNLPAAAIGHLLAVISDMDLVIATDSISRMSFEMHYWCYGVDEAGY